VLNALKAVLQLETVEYKQMLALAAEKKDALFKNQVSDLDAVVAREITVLKRIKQLEKEREALIERAAVLSHRPKSTMHLNDIIEIASGDMHEEFIRIRDELNEVIMQLKLSNKANNGLIETQLQYASFCVNLLSGHVNMLGTYSNGGGMNEKQEKATFLIDQSV
jgi:flagellar biosynthesis/type III secretory pathway chaperone